MRKVLVQEVACRRLQRRPSRGMSDESALGRLSTQANRAGDVVDTWLATFEDLSDLSVKAGRTAHILGEAMAESKRTADAITDSSQSTEPALRPLVSVLTLWTSMDAEIAPLIDEVVADLHALATSADLTSFRLAIAHVQVESMRSFISEIWAEMPGWERALPAVSYTHLTLPTTPYV